MDKPFDQLPTEQFRRKLLPARNAIYESLFPGCRIEDLRQDGPGAHVLDQHYGIDTQIHTSSGQTFTLQEKFRDEMYLHNGCFQVEPGHPDFTIEYMNASGTIHQCTGEWFHLCAQFYFYAWADRSCEQFAQWALLDIAKLKLIIDQWGGLDRIGQKKFNKSHGRASFYAIPMHHLATAILRHHENVTPLELFEATIPDWLKDE